MFKASILWNKEKQKYQLISPQGSILVTSKDRGYLNYLVVYQRHSAIIAAGITAVETLSLKPPEPSKPQPDRPHVSALLWESILKKPFELRPGIPGEVKKTRGRPRKYFPKVEGVHRHKMNDEEPDSRNLLPATIKKLTLDFKEYLQEGKIPREALDEICKLYRIPYAQAFNICVDCY